MMNYDWDRRGFTLIELLFVVAIIMILAGMATLGVDFIRKERLRSSTRELLADLQRARLESMTHGPTAGVPKMRGYGIRVTATSYTTFMFYDSNENWQYDGVTEESQAKTKTLPTPVAVSPGLILIFDRTGYPRGTAWESLTPTFITQHQGINESKCVNVGLNTIREGWWNGTICQEQ